MKSAGISNKLVWYLPLGLALIVALTGWWANRQIGRAIKESIRNEMESALIADVTALEIWFENQKRLAKSIAGDPEISEQVLKLIEDPASYQPQAMHHSGVLMSNTFEYCLQQRVDEIDYIYAFVANTDLEVVHHFMGNQERLLDQIPDPLQRNYSQLFESNEAVVITPFHRPQLPGAGREPGRRGRPPGRFGGPGGRQGGESLGTRPPRPAFPPGGPGRGPRFGKRGFKERIPDHLLELMQQDTLMQVAAPVTDDTGQVKGAIAFFIDPESEFSKIMSVARPGQSGETYAFDATGVMVSMSRFDDQLNALGLIPNRPNSSSALNLVLKDPGHALKAGETIDQSMIDAWPYTQVVRTTRAYLEQSMDLDPEATFLQIETTPFRDYRGIEVVGAWTWLPHYQLGMAIQIDADEAYRPLYMLRWVFVVLILLLLLAATVIFLFSMLNVRWRQQLAMAQLEAKRLGQYHLEAKIGEGGMGTVYRAKHALLRRETAIKLLMPDKADPLSLQRFEREVKITSRLTHPNTIQVFDYGHTPQGLFYYAMEYLDGINLKDLVLRYGPQPSSRVAYILSHVCESLQEAHREGLIHRDIKPANIILCERGGVPDFVKVLDFGLVRHYDEPNQDHTQITATTTVSGTPQFLAPEAIRHPDQADPRSDIYAVGAVGYFLLTGHYVFEGQSMMEIFEKHLTEQPTPPSSKTSQDVHPCLEQILIQCLSKDPDDRPESVGYLAEQLNGCLMEDDWSTARRIEWWSAFHEAKAGASTTTKVSSQTTLDKTVLIDLDDRS